MRGSFFFFLVFATLFAGGRRCYCEEAAWPTIQNGRSANCLVFADYIYWRFSSPSLFYVRNGVGLTNTIPSVEIHDVKRGKGFLPDYDYQSGFKVGLGVKFGPHKAFDLIAYNIWIRSTPHGSVSKSSSPLLPISWVTSATLASNTYSKASLSLNLIFNCPELQSGYTFNINKYLSLRPYIALAAIITDGKLDARYEFTTPAHLFEISKTHGKCFSWSIGPKMGLDFVVHATKHLGIYSNVNFSQQASYIRMTTKETIDQPANGESFVIQNGKLTQDRNINLVGLEVGPTWDQWFACQKYRLQLRATWQLTTFVNGANLSFLNNANVDIFVGTEFRGLNVRATFEF